VGFAVECSALDLSIQNSEEPDFSAFAVNSFLTKIFVDMLLLPPQMVRSLSQVLKIRIKIFVRSRKTDAGTE